MDLTYIRRVERWNYALGAVLVMASAAAFSRAGALGVLVGAALSCLNFTFMRRLGERWMATPPEKRQIQVILLFPKMLALLAVVAVALLYLPISAMGLAIGFSVFLLSIGIETFRYITNPPARGDAGGGGPDAPQ